MKLSDKTQMILENFSKISNSMYFYAGTKQKIMTPAKTIFSEVILDEDFPSDFGIYDMSKFLSVMSLFDSPELEFSDKNVKISDKKSTATFWFTSKELISNVVVPLDKSITLSNVDLSFEMSKETFKHIKSSSSVLGVPHFVIQGDGSKINIVTTDADNDTSNKISKEVGDTTETFKFIGDIANLRMLDDDYDVKVSKAGIIEMKSKNNKLTFWLAIRK